MIEVMSLQTVFTEAMSVRHPIALAPMGGSAGGALAASVSNGGGLGLVGGGRGERGWLERELGIVAEQTSQPWGVGFLAWAVDESTVAWALGQQPNAVMLSFGDPTPFASRIKAAGVPLFVQVTDMTEAQRAADLGADVIIAQGAEAGARRFPSSRPWSTSSLPPRCLPQAASPTAAVSLQHSC
jgi:nitronate monooxygenase